MKLGIKIVENIQSGVYRLVDSWHTKYISNRLKECGRGNHFYYYCELTGAEFMRVGNNIHINRGAYIRAEGGLYIGDNVHIGRNLVLYTINHNFMGSALPYDNTHIEKQVVIEKNVWIGINVTIVPGVHIGEGAIIGAGTVVAQDIPPMAIVGSQPVRILKYRDQTHYEKLDSLACYGGVNGKLYNK